MAQNDFFFFGNSVGLEIWGDLPHRIILFSLTCHIFFHFQTPRPCPFPISVSKKVMRGLSPGCPVQHTLGGHTQNTWFISCSWAQIPLQYGGKCSFFNHWLIWKPRWNSLCDSYCHVYCRSDHRFVFWKFIVFCRLFVVGNCLLWYDIFYDLLLLVFV